MLEGYKPTKTEAAAIVQRASMSRVDAFDTALERVAFLASVVLLWIAGASVGYLLAIWFFN